MVKKIIFGLLGLLAVAGVGYYMMNREVLKFETVCVANNTKFNEELCGHVGKRAYSLSRMSSLNDRDFGKIVGVAWRTKGTQISAAGQKKRVSPKNGYYYIIQQDGSDYSFLRLVEETEPRYDPFGKK